MTVHVHLRLSHCLEDNVGVAKPFLYELCKLGWLLEPTQKSGIHGHGQPSIPIAVIIYCVILGMVLLLRRSLLTLGCIMDQPQSLSNG